MAASTLTLFVKKARRPNGDLRTRECLTEAEVEKLMTTAGRNRWGHRGATMILVAYRHGLRVAELVDLRWDQVDFKTAILHVRRVKAGTPSTHPILGDELRALRRLQREQPQSPFVFISERGAPFTTAGFARMVERAGIEARLGFKAHPHMLRHACGYALANRGHDTRALQAYLGHRNIQHTVRYTELSPTRFKACADHAAGFRPKSIAIRFVTRNFRHAVSLPDVITQIFEVGRLRSETARQRGFQRLETRPQAIVCSPPHAAWAFGHRIIDRVRAEAQSQFPSCIQSPSWGAFGLAPIEDCRDIVGTDSRAVRSPNKDLQCAGYRLGNETRGVGHPGHMASTIYARSAETFRAQTEDLSGSDTRSYPIGAATAVRTVPAEPRRQTGVHD